MLSIRAIWTDDQACSGLGVLLATHPSGAMLAWPKGRREQLGFECSTVARDAGTASSHLHICSVSWHQLSLAIPNTAQPTEWLWKGSPLTEATGGCVGLGAHTCALHV